MKAKDIATTSFYFAPTEEEGLVYSSWGHAKDTTVRSSNATGRTFELIRTTSKGCLGQYLRDSSSEPNPHMALRRAMG